MKDAAQQRKDDLTLQRRLAVMEGYLKGHNQFVLAKEHGVAQSTISTDLAWVRKAWLKSTMLDIDEAKARELARIDKLEIAYWAEWERSQQPRTTKRSVKTAKSRPSKQRQAKSFGSRDQADQVDTERFAEEWEEVEEALGNPVYLQGVQWCVAARCKIMGLNAADRQEITGKGGKDLIPAPVPGTAMSLAFYEMAPDEASRVAAILREAGAQSDFDDEASR